MDNINFAARIKAARRTAGLTQDDLSDKAGLSYSTLSKIEQGTITNPSFLTIVELAKALDVSLNYLAGMEEKTLVEGLKALTEPIKVVLFDVHGTLVANWHHIFAEIGESLGREPLAVEEAFWRLNADVCSGLTSVEDFERITARFLNVGPHDLHYFEHYQRVCQPFASAHHLLQSFKQAGFKVGILTNIFPGGLEVLARSGATPASENFDYIIESYSVGSVKPAAAIYQAAETVVRVPASQILLIDDLAINTEAAVNRGWQAIVYDQERLHMAETRIKELTKITI